VGQPPIEKLAKKNLTKKNSKNQLIFTVPIHDGWPHFAKLLPFRIRLEGGRQHDNREKVHYMTTPDFSVD
jgi:hypothetical protein